MKLYNILQIWKKFFDNWEYAEALQIFLKIQEKWVMQKNILYFIIFSYFQKWDYLNSVVFIKIFEKNFWFERKVFLVKNLILWDFWKYEKILENYKNLEIWENSFEIILFANIYRNKWDYKKSLKILKIWLQKFPNNSRLLYKLSLVLNILWREKEALFFAKKSFDIDWYLYSLDLFLRILKNIWIKKEKYILFFQKIDLNFDEYKNDFTCIWNIFYTLWDYWKSEIFYKKSIKNTKYDFYAYNWLWNVYVKNWNYKQAKTYYKYSLLINKQNFYTLNSLWKIFYKENNFEISEKFYRKSLEINENNFEALKNLWILYYKNWEFQKSKKFLQKSLQINKTDFMVIRYLNKFQKYENAL